MRFNGFRLQELRKKKGYTQTDLAKKICRAKSTVAGYETANSSPDTDTLAELAIELDTTADYLLGLIDEPNRIIYKYAQLPRFITDAGIDNLPFLKNCNLQELTLEEMEALIQIVKRIKQRQDEEKNHP
jgi:transcriptional regulator with XRE-family HTH domain